MTATVEVPHADEAEEALLGAMLLSPEAVKAAAGTLAASDFYRPSNGHVFAAIVSLADQECRVDVVTVTHELDRLGLLEHVSGGSARLIAIQSATPAVSNAPRYAEIVAQAARRRLTMALGAEIVECGREGRDPSDVLDRLATLSTGPNERTDAAVEWPEFWERDRRPEDWCIPNIIPASRQVTLWAKRKTGKSLFALDVSAAAAAGRPILGEAARPPVEVLYLDFEMTEDDLHERLSDLGYGPDADLSAFHYVLLPTLPPLDTAAGGAALASLVEEHGADLVVIDTLARVISGEENSADTYRAFYRHTGLRLKQMGVAVLRLDHGGKESDRGERGSSAKGDDVDLSWELRDAGGGDMVLIRSYSRISWAAERIELHRHTEPVLAHRIRRDSWPAGTEACATALDTAGVPLDATIAEAIAALKEADLSPRRREIVAAALRWRRHPDRGRA